MTLRLKQDTKTQKKIGREKLNIKGKTLYLEISMTLKKDKPFFIKRTNLDKQMEGSKAPQKDKP